MIRQNLKIENIPVILWGDKSDKLFVAVHGNMSNKADDAIVFFAEEAAAKGHQVLSFDLPEHGDRKDENYPCKVQNCVQDLYTIMNYAHSLSKDISLFACSMGAYFSLLAYMNPGDSHFTSSHLKQRQSNSLSDSHFTSHILIYCGVIRAWKWSLCLHLGKHLFPLMCI